MTLLAKAVQTTANTEQLLYTVPASTEVLCSVNVCNKDTSTAKVRIGLLSSGESSTAAGGFIEYDAQIPAGGVLERTGILLSAGEKIAVNSDTATNVAYVVVGKAAAA
jgi:hypothetical protein